jgi:transcriptional regulator with XRE-family HTH domain
MASRLQLDSYLMPYTMSPGAELRAIRQHLGLTQPVFARQLGVHAISLCRWERGSRPVPATVLLFARLLIATRPPPHLLLLDTMPDKAHPDEPIIHVEHSFERCHWPRADGVECTAPTLRLTCQLSRRRHLVTTACQQHLWPAYEAIDTRIVAKVKAEQHRQACLRRKREARRQAREGTTAPAAADPTST